MQCIFQNKGKTLVQKKKNKYGTFLLINSTLGPLLSEFVTDQHAWWSVIGLQTTVFNGQSATKWAAPEFNVWNGVNKYKAALWLYML